ncbi:MAG: AMP-binding protein [Acidobacteriota bacterium]
MQAGDATLHALIGGLRRFGDRRAVASAGLLGARWWTFRRLADAIDGAARRLRARGVARGERVALCADASPEWLATLCALIECDAVAVLVDPADVGDRGEQVEELAQRGGARRILRPADIESLVGAVSGRDAAALADTKHHEPSGSDRSADTPAVVLFTSGSTASARPVELAHGQLMAQVDAFRGWAPAARRVRVRMLSLVPAAHSFGLVVSVWIPLALGLGVVHPRRPALGDGPHLWARWIRDHGVNIVVAVPRQLDLLRRLVVSSDPRRRTDQAVEALLRPRGLGAIARVFWLRGRLFSRLRCRALFVGGAPLPADVARFWRRAGLLVVQGYGQTETAGVVTLSLRGADVGRPLRGRRVELTDDGEIVLGGPMLANAASRYTGDLGTVDARGRLHVVGRLDYRIALASGELIEPWPLEQRLAAWPGVASALVLGVDHGRGAELHAVLVGAGERPLGESERDRAAAAVRAVNAELPTSTRIVGWSMRHADDLPRGALGEVRRRALALELTAESGAKPERTEDLVEICAEPDPSRRLDRLVARLRAPRPLSDQEARLHLAHDLGLSSLTRAELMLRLDARPATGRALDESLDLAADATAGDLAARVAGSATDRQRSSRGRPSLPTRQPRWARWPPLSLLRRLVRRVVLGVWRRARSRRLEIEWRIDPSSLDGPVLFATAPHDHWLDTFAVASAAPPHLARRLVAVTNHDFAPFFAPAPKANGRRRRGRAGWISGGGYFVGLPLVFDFAILGPERPTAGLLDLARWLDRGFSPIAFPRGLRHFRSERHDPGACRLSLETGRPLVPLHLETDDEVTRVIGGAPIEPRAGESVEELMARLEAAWFGLKPPAPRNRI